MNGHSSVYSKEYRTVVELGGHSVQAPVIRAYLLEFHTMMTSP